MLARVGVLSAFAAAVERTAAQLEEPGAATATGSSACPCVDPWAATSFATAEQQAAFDATQCRNGTRGGRAPGSLAVSCLVADFGASRCEPWDQQLSPECVNADGQVPGSGQPEWCSSLWCYVDKNACDRPYTSSRLAWPGVTGLPDDGLAFSHETCGNVDECELPPFHQHS